MVWFQGVAWIGWGVTLLAALLAAGSIMGPPLERFSWRWRGVVPDHPELALVYKEVHARHVAGFFGPVAMAQDFFRQGLRDPTLLAPYAREWRQAEAEEKRDPAWWDETLDPYRVEHVVGRAGDEGARAREVLRQWYDAVPKSRDFLLAQRLTWMLAGLILLQAGLLGQAWQWPGHGLFSMGVMLAALLVGSGLAGYAILLLNESRSGVRTMAMLLPGGALLVLYHALWWPGVLPGLASSLGIVAILGCLATVWLILGAV